MRTERRLDKVRYCRQHHFQGVCGADACGPHLHQSSEREIQGKSQINDFNELIAKKLPKNCSVDAYIFWDEDKLHLGMTVLKSFTDGVASEEWNQTMMTMPINVNVCLNPGATTSKKVDNLGLFETEIYVSGTHGANTGYKTFTFKPCVFLKRIGSVGTAKVWVAAIESRPSPLCYLHYPAWGGVIGDAAADDTAFGCRE